MSTLDRLYAKSSGLAEYASRYALYLADLLAELDCEAIERVGRLFEETRLNGRTIFLIGNGGSASTASHFANDLGLGTRVRGGKAYRAISLADNVAFLTAAGNDLGYETVFVEQLKTLLTRGDVVVGISASGNSPNVVKAIEFAKEHGAITVGLTGFDGGKLKKIVDESIHIDTLKGDYGPVEDLHLMLDHLLSSYLARLTADESKSEPTRADSLDVPGVAALRSGSTEAFQPT